MLLIKVQSLLMSDDQESSRDESEFDSDLPGILPGVIWIVAILCFFLSALEKGCKDDIYTGTNKLARVAIASTKILFWLPDCSANENPDSQK